MFLPLQWRKQDKDTVKKEGLEILAIEMNDNANRSLSLAVIDLVVYIDRSFSFYLFFLYKKTQCQIGSNEAWNIQNHKQMKHREHTDTHVIMQGGIYLKSILSLKLIIWEKA